MGRHEIGEDGISYSIAKRMENDAEKAELDIHARLFILRHKCFRFVLHSGTHIGSLVVLHVIALGVLDVVLAAFKGGGPHSA